MELSLKWQKSAHSEIHILSVDVCVTVKEQMVNNAESQQVKKKNNQSIKFASINLPLGEKITAMMAWRM